MPSGAAQLDFSMQINPSVRQETNCLFDLFSAALIFYLLTWSARELDAFQQWDVKQLNEAENRLILPQAAKSLSGDVHVKPAQAANVAE